MRFNRVSPELMNGWAGVGYDLYDKSFADVLQACNRASLSDWDCLFADHWTEWSQLLTAEELSIIVRSRASRYHIPTTRPGRSWGSDI
jgi:hypothetical protein